MSQTFHRWDLVVELVRQCRAMGGQAAWARARGIPASTVSETLSGKREMSEAIINALGFVRAEFFIRARPRAVSSAPKLTRSNMSVSQSGDE